MIFARVVSRIIKIRPKRQWMCPATTRLFSSASLKGDLIKLSKSANGIINMTLSRHEGKNSLSKAMLQEFNDTVTAISEDDSARVVILSSDVPKVFCAGADLKERLSMPENQIAGFVAHLRETFNRFSKIPVPTIAAIEGAALGGGLELALACDMRIVGESALLGLPETALAIIPGAGGTQRLSRVVGPAKAKELIYMAKRFKGPDALTLGIANECVATGGALDRATEIADLMCTHGPVGLRMAKKAIDEGLQQASMDDALGVESICYAQTVPTLDRVEGLKAFGEKRKPVYLGK